MRRILTLLLPVLAAISAGCSTIRVETDYDRGADFSSLRTYAWVKHVKASDSRMMNDPLIRSHITGSVESELAEMGYRKAAGRDPDFLVAYHIGSRRKIDVDHYYYGYGRWGRFRGHDVSVHRYREGTIVLDIVDARTKQLIWRGWARSVLHGREDAAEDIRASVRKILERFPPR